MYPQFRKYFFPASEDSSEIPQREDELSEYQRRFRWVDTHNESKEEEVFSPGDRNMGDSRPEPQSNPIPKLAFPKDIEARNKPTQKPAIPLLNISAQDSKGKEQLREALEIKDNTKNAPGIKGISLDITQVSRKVQYEDYDMSSDRIYEESCEMSSSRASNPPNKGISLDLTKAKAIQNEILNQGPTGKSLIPNLSLPGQSNQDRKIPSLGIPVSSGSRSNEGESSHRMEVEQSTGPQLKINIKNVAKLKEDTEMKIEEDIFEPPKHRRGCAQPDEPMPESNNNRGDENPDYMSKSTSVAEARNNRFKNICSEILPSFLYLGSDYLAKDKDILLEHNITHIINSAGDYSPNYHEEDFKYLTFHLKDHPRENIE